MGLTTAVVGAGIFGVTATLELRRRGHAVTLVDPGPLPRPLAASADSCKAVRVEYGSDDLLSDLAESALPGWLALNDRTRRTLFHADGWLFLTRAPMAAGGFEFESRRHLGRRARGVMTLRGAEIRSRFPAWARGAHAEAFFSPRDGWVESAEVLALLLREAAEQGVLLLAGARVDAFLVEQGGARRAVPAGVELPAAPVVGLRAGGRDLLADQVLVCAGAWTPALLPHLRPLLTVVGQPVIHLRPADPEPFRAPRFCGWAADIATTGYYGFPLLPDGTVKLAHHGAGLPMDPESPPAVPQRALDAARTFLSGVLPALADAPLDRARLCPYADTADGRFLIDRDPQRPGLVLASGDSGHAFKFTPLLGALIAEAVEGRPHPAFAWRKPISRKEPSRVPH